MGKRREKDSTRSQTLPPSPSHSFSSSSSSSSSDFEFTISNSSHKPSSTLCPADELFYKGQLLPLHLSSRISVVRTLLLASSSASSSSCDTATTASRDSTGSASSNDSNSSFNSELVFLAECDSSRPSSVTEDEEFRRLNGNGHQGFQQIKKPKYFSLTRLFKKDSKSQDNKSSVKRMSSTAKEVLRKYFKKVKPLYEKLSQKQQQQKMGGGVVTNITCVRSVRDHIEASAHGKNTRKENTGGFSHSLSGNLRYPRRKSCVSSCPSSMRSSPNHSGALSRSGFSGMRGSGGARVGYTDTSSMEELQSAIQGAIAHCKNSMNKSLVSNEI